MTSFRITASPHKRAGGRFTQKVRRQLQKAFAEEKESRGLKQSDLAKVLGVNRSVITRQLQGYQNLTLSTVGELAFAMGRDPEFLLKKKELEHRSNSTLTPATPIIETKNASTDNELMLGPNEKAIIVVKTASSAA